MAYEQIALERRGAVALVTLSRPQKLNAWTYQMNDELIAAIDATNRDDDLGAIVLTGAGRGFCAGADLIETTRPGPDGRRPRPGREERWAPFVRQSKPVVAAVNGVAIGIGATLVLPCDVILASERASMSFPFVKMGVTPELCSSHFLVQRAGFGRASEMCLSARSYPADELLQARLVDHVVPAEELVERAVSLAAEIAAHPGPQLRMVKELLDANGCCDDLDAVERRESEVLRQARRSPEHREAIAAFVEKRAPDFRNLRG